MPMTITEKILAAHAGKESVSPGELIEVEVDLAWGLPAFSIVGAPDAEALWCY